MLLRGLLDWPENVDHSIQLAQDDDDDCDDDGAVRMVHFMFRLD